MTFYQSTNFVDDFAGINQNNQIMGQRLVEGNVLIGKALKSLTLKLGKEDNSLSTSRIFARLFDAEGRTKHTFGETTVGNLQLLPTNTQGRKDWDYLDINFSIPFNGIVDEDDVLGIQATSNLIKIGQNNEPSPKGYRARGIPGNLKFDGSVNIYFAVDYVPSSLLYEEPTPETAPEPTPIIISAEVQTILTKFDNNDYTSPTWFNSNIGFVKNGSISSNEFLDSFNSLLQAGTIIDKTIPVEKEYDVTVLRINEFGGVYAELFYGIKGNKLLELEYQFLVILSDKPRPTDDEVRDYYNFVDTSIDSNMVSQSIGAFTLKDGKVTGKIIYIAESAFNSYYYNKTIYSTIQIKDQAGNTIKLKTNNLNFTATERDETITINEGVGDLNAVKIEFYVSKNVDGTLPFTLKKVDEIVAQEIGLKPCPIGQHRNFNGKCVADDQPSIGGKPSVIALLGGVTALIGTLALLGSKRR